jgi:MFS family permease
LNITMTAATNSSLYSDLRSLPRAYWVLVAGTFINRFGSFVYPFLTIFLTRRGLSLWEIGAVIAGYGGGGLMASLAGGWFADRFGRRNTIVAGTLANAICVFALYYAHTLPELVLLTLCAGISGGFYHPASNALVADLIPENLRLAAYAVLRQSANAGFAFGTAAAGFLVSHSTFWLFAGDALTTASYGILALLLLPHGLRHTSTQARWSEALTRIRRDGRFWALYAAQFLCALIFSQFASSYALEVGRRGLHLGTLLPEQIYGTLIGWNGLMVLFVELPLTRLTQRYDARRVMCLGYALIGIGFATNAWSAGLAGLFMGMTVFTLGETLALPMVSTWVAHLAPEPMRGRYIGALSTSWAGASMIGPAIGLQAYGFHPAMLWFGCAALGGLGALIMARWGDTSTQRDVAIRREAVLEPVE